MRYTDGVRERLGAVEYKLFVGSLNKQAIVEEVEEIFSKYGQVEDVYLMRDKNKQNRGCGFVKYSQRDMAFLHLWIFSLELLHWSSPKGAPSFPQTLSLVFEIPLCKLSLFFFQNRPSFFYCHRTLVFLRSSSLFFLS